MIFFKDLCCLVLIIFGLPNVDSQQLESTDKKVTYSKKDILVTIKDIVFIIRNQHHSLSVKRAKNIKDEILKAAVKNGKQEVPDVLMLHEDWAPNNGWTILPIFNYIFRNYQLKKWYFFCEDTTEIDLEGLIHVLNRYDYSQDYFLGHALYDTNAAIIHHFAFYQNTSSFAFPDFDSGWALTATVLKKAIDKLKGGTQTDFSIDVKHEIALFLSNQKRRSDRVDHSVNGTLLTDVKEFCVNKPLHADSCVTTVQYKKPDCGLTDKNEILIAVKTCKKFHENRVPIIKQTLGLHATHIRYYSDVIDESIPTEYIDVANTERGHCQKLHNIIKRSSQGDLKHIDWLVVVDDDTVMNYERLRRLLACYDPSETIILGERYGYAINHRNAGFSYPTGGGGMVLSRGAVHEIVSKDVCHCMSNDSPDDMWLGQCASHIRHHLVHTNSFHQARADEYSKDFLSHRYLVSFHKHSGDPLRDYQNHLTDSDDNLNVTKKVAPSNKEEL